MAAERLTDRAEGRVSRAPGSHRIDLWVPDELFAAAQAFALTERRTLTNAVIYLLWHGLAAVEDAGSNGRGLASSV